MQTQTFVSSQRALPNVSPVSSVVKRATASNLNAQKANVAPDRFSPHRRLNAATSLKLPNVPAQAVNAEPTSNADNSSGTARARRPIVEQKTSSGPTGPSKKNVRSTQYATLTAQPRRARPANTDVIWEFVANAAPEIAALTDILTQQQHNAAPPSNPPNADVRPANAALTFNVVINIVSALGTRPDAAQTT